MTQISKYTKEEEKLNAISHFIGIVVGVVVGWIFVSAASEHGDALAVASVLLYIFGMMSSYVFSTLYHACPPEKALKLKLRRCDHAAIYWHIAGSYSPITLIAMRDCGYWGWGLFAFVWLCAIVGTLTSFFNLKKHSRIETLCYVLMGMVVLVAFKQLLDAVEFNVVAWLIAEGVCYIAGAVLYSIHKVKFMHSIFHLFVLAGTVCHLIVVWKVLQILIL